MHANTAMDKYVNSASALKAIEDLIKNADLSPHALKRAFTELGENPEKFRAILNFIFVPLFRPTFDNDDPAAAAAALDHVELLDGGSEHRTQTPYRMFDIDTGNMVEFPDVGELGQYSMLSHRWKGAEVQLADIMRARGMDLKDIRAASDRKQAAGMRWVVNDVNLTLEQCRLDVLEQENTVKERAAETGSEISIGDLLVQRLSSMAAKASLSSAKKRVERAKSELMFAERERKVFGDLISKMKEDMNDKMAGMESEAKRGAATSDISADEVVNEARKAISAAETARANAEVSYTAAKQHLDFFDAHKRLREAVDDMLVRLQKWKSAIKIVESIDHARDIYDKKLFRRREKSYMWLDTCCINKLNAGELSESISLMGDWYAGAEFTLVQLDSRYSPDEAADDWVRFQGEEEGKVVVAGEGNIKGFEHVGGQEPEWSERGWTLQELVMSKTTYYVNSKWEPLGRPVDSLGYVYDLIPFIALYCKGVSQDVGPPALDFEALHAIVETLEEGRRYQELEAHIEAVHTSSNGHVDNADIAAKAEDEASHVKKALRILAVLHGLGVQFPAAPTLETAKAELAQAVYNAAERVATAEDEGAKRAILKALETVVPRPPFDVSSNKLLEFRYMINVLLQSLVAEVENLVLDDRRYISDFGKVHQLKAWRAGTLRTGFPTQEVMASSCKRLTTMPTDPVYALMGVLNVRFPMFTAEGYAKALSRLLDEVIVTHNDVSVFNWSGIDMGSPIRGRSMYPSSHRAYATGEDRGSRYNLLVSREAQGKMAEVMETYHGVIPVLGMATKLVKRKELKNLPLDWFRKIIEFVQKARFQIIKAELLQIGKLLQYVVSNLDAPASSPPVQSPVSIMPGPKRTDSSSSGFSSLTSNFRPSLPDTKSFKGLSGKKTPSLSSVTKGFSASFGSKTLGSPKAAPESPEPSPASATAAVPIEQQIDDLPPWAPSPEVDSGVRSYLSSLERGITQPPSPLPEEVSNVLFTIPKPPAATTSTGQDDNEKSTRMISPNPIIVNNAGIESIFDIQRVVLTMIDQGKLRQQVANASSPQQKISGWCSVSTGMASVVVRFLCEAHMLEKELDVVESVEHTVLGEQDREEGKRRGDVLAKGLSVTRITEKLKQLDSDHVPSAEGEDAVGDDDHSEEERVVSRMIRFVQQQDLRLVAGEWVLARVSGVPGANWFLCQLELGSTHQFYGRRIATSEIDFGNSAPETGLVKAWQTYMERKKRKMCGIMGRYLDIRETEGRRRNVMDNGLENMRKGVMGFGSKSKEARSKGKDESSDDEEDGDVWNLDQLREHGSETVMALGESVLLAGLEKMLEMDADRVERNLNASVLKKTPKALRSAIENINDNGHFLPSMFHSGKRIHMF